MPKKKEKVTNEFHILLTHEGDSIGVQTKVNGREIPPTFYTSRPMTDVEIGRVFRMALAVKS